MTERVTIEKLVHGGQGIGTLADGRRVFVWNALPGETVEVELSRNKRSHAEGVAVEILKPSSERIAAVDDAYLSTSPWQMMTYDAENTYKKYILAETLAREHVNFDQEIAFQAPKEPLHYRNKMEYSFWADDGGLHLALFNRGSHGKRIITGSSIAMPVIDSTAEKVLKVLNTNQIRGSQLKTVVLRANQKREVSVALFVKDESFPQIAELAEIGKGLVVYYSTPKSPASVMTSELYRFGDTTLEDTLLGVPIAYDVMSFFQVNLAICEPALENIRDFIANTPYVDMYSGVGTIGIALGGAGVLVESDSTNCRMAERNVEGTNTKVVNAPAESALDYILADSALIVDPPRAGLHQKVVTRILEVLPPKIAYLSCNPITLGRDLALLQSTYELHSLTGYNFFPRTPHIEALTTLVRKDSTDTN